MTEGQINRLLELNSMGCVGRHENGLMETCIEDEFDELCLRLVEALSKLPGFAKWWVIKILAKGNDIDE